MKTPIRAWKTGLVILGVHLGLIGLVVAKAAYDQATLPRAWARVQSVDRTPSENLGPRYVHLHVCPATWPSGTNYNFPVRLRSLNGSLVAEGSGPGSRVYLVRSGPMDVCLAEPLQLYLEQGGPTPQGSDLTVELLLPPNEVPRAIRLRKGVFKPD